MTRLATIAVQAVLWLGIAGSLVLARVEYRREQRRSR